MNIHLNFIIFFVFFFLLTKSLILGIVCSISIILIEAFLTKAVNMSFNKKDS
jgi:hypothetical protein